MRFHDLQKYLLISLAIYCPTNLSADETAERPGAVWERFRGPNGTGTSDDKEIPLKFGANENMIWKVDLAGAGNSSPIVWGQHLFLHAASKDGKQRSLICFDTADGKVRWEKSIAAVSVKLRPDSSLASATPTTDGKAVYVPFWDGKHLFLAAYDFQGSVLWTKDLGEYNSQHGAGASPILYKNTLFLANDMDREDFYSKAPIARPSTLIALDKKTGRLLWENARVPERACYSAPFLLARAGQKEPELVVFNSHALTGYNVETGAKIWDLKEWHEGAGKVPYRTIASVALAGDLLCICGGGDAGRLGAAFSVPSSGVVEAPKRLWENRKDFPYVPSPVVRGEHIYFVNDSGFAGCYQVRTGNRVWFERLSEIGFNASPLLIDGKIYAINSAGDVFVVAAEPTYRQLARNELGETIRATPAVAAGRLYIRGERHLFCIGKKN